MCFGCLEKTRDNMRAKRTERLAAGLCVQCGKARKLPHSVACEPCFFKTLSHDHFGSRADAPFLTTLFYANGGRCVYSGLPLTLGLDTHIDHIEPVAKGGSLAPENVQFVHSMINQMKWSYSEDEFLRMVKTIYEHRRLRRVR